MIHLFFSGPAYDDRKKPKAEQYTCAMNYLMAYKRNMPGALTGNSAEVHKTFSKPHASAERRVLRKV